MSHVGMNDCLLFIFQPPSETSHKRHTWTTEHRTAMKQMAGDLIHKMLAEGRTHPLMGEIRDMNHTHPEQAKVLENMSLTRQRDKVRSMVEGRLRDQMKAKK